MAYKKQTYSIKKEEEELRKFLRQIYILLGLGCILYYLFPFLFIMMGIGQNKEAWTGVMSILLMGVYPFYPFIACFINTRYHGFRWFLPIIFGGYFVPAAMIYLGATALPYAIVYIALGYFGCLGGWMMVRRIQRQQLKKEKALHGQKGKKVPGHRRKKS